jgi:Rieske Fe-S protein
MGAAGTALVGLSIAATPRHLVAIVSGKAVLKKVTPLKKLKVGVNGPFAFTVDTTDSLNTNQIFLVRDAKGKVVALEATCRHMGCQINWVGADKKFECPCHGSQYAMSGKVVQGPAQHNLYQHKVVVKAGQVWVMTTRSTS